MVEWWSGGVEWIRTRPSNSPSPVVAQLGTTYQSLSFSWSSFSRSWTSAGFIAARMGGA